MRMQTPNINHILRTIATHTVCTGVQCFETPEDAGFGQLPSNEASTPKSFWIMMALFVSLLILHTPSSLQLSSKPAPIVISTIDEQD